MAKKIKITQTLCALLLPLLPVMLAVLIGWGLYRAVRHRSAASF